MKEEIVIGIDPDVTASGVAVVTGERCMLYSLNFGELVSFLQVWRDRDPFVVVEAGWLNQKASWHCSPHEPNNVSAKKGLAVGRNQQIGHDIVDICRVYNLRVHEQIPLRKCWKGKDGKITHEELTQFIQLDKKRSNQEERDAALLAWVVAGRPIRVKK